MQPAGRAKIEAAIADGTWTVHDDVEALEIPAELEQAFEANPSANATYNALTRGRKNMVLSYRNSAKPAETRPVRVGKIGDSLTAGGLPFP